MSTNPENESHGASAFDAAAELARKKAMEVGDKLVGDIKETALEKLETAPVDALVAYAEDYRAKNNPAAQEAFTALEERGGQELETALFNNDWISLALSMTVLGMKEIPENMKAAHLRFLVLSGALVAKPETIKRIEDRSGLIEWATDRFATISLAAFPQLKPLFVAVQGMQFMSLATGKGKEIATQARAKLNSTPEVAQEPEPDTTLHEKHDEEMNVIEGLPAQANTNEGFKQEEAA